MTRIQMDNSIIIEDMEQIFQSGCDWDRLDGAKIYLSGASGMVVSYATAFLIYLNEVKGFSITIYAGIRSREKAYARFGSYVDKPYFHLCTKDVEEPLPDTVKADYIIHGASLASPQYYGLYPVETMLPNVVGTYCLLEYARKVNVKGFLFLSSGSVYGDTSVLKDMVHREGNIGCMNHLSQNNLYGESKRCGEALCFAYNREYGVPANICRVHHTYGPTMDCEGDRRVFSDFAGSIVANRDIIMKSDGTDERTFCYLSDTVSAMYRILLEGKTGEAYNIANAGECMTIRGLAELLTGLYPERKLKVVVADRAAGENYVESEKRIGLLVSCEKLFRLGWKPVIPAKEGFMRTINYLEGSNIGTYVSGGGVKRVLTAFRGGLCHA